jgi:hypothetical protein
VSNDDRKAQLDIFTSADNDYTIEITGVSDTIDTSNISSSTMSSWSTDTVTLGSTPTFTVSTDSEINSTYTFGGDDITITTHEPVDFIDQLPTLNKIQAMCREYPGLDKAFDNFKITYKMVHQDWVGKKKKNG